MAIFILHPLEGSIITRLHKTILNLYISIHMKRLGLVILLSLFLSQVFAQDSENFRMILKDDWQMQSALKVTDKGDVVSQSKFQPQGWYKVSVPTTIIAGLLAN